MTVNRWIRMQHKRSFNMIKLIVAQVNTLQRRQMFEHGRFYVCQTGKGNIDCLQMEVFNDFYNGIDNRTD